MCIRANYIERERKERRKKCHDETNRAKKKQHHNIFTSNHTLYQFLHFKQTLNAKSFQYDANTSKREERDGQNGRERESAVVEHESASNEREKHLQSSQLSSK